MSDSPAPVAPSPVTITVALNQPIARQSGASVASLTLRKPKAGELRGLNMQDLMQADVNAVMTLVPRISDPFVIAEEIANLEADDFAELAGAVLSFFFTPAQRALASQMLGASA
jgi:hypothetical protein